MLLYCILCRLDGWGIFANWRIQDLRLVKDLLLVLASLLLTH